MNHFLSTPVANPVLAAEANEWGILRYRALKCEQYWGAHAVNFPTVDFWSVGDVVGTAMYLNLNSTERGKIDSQLRI